MSKKSYLTLALSILALSAFTVIGLIGSRTAVARTSVSAASATAHTQNSFALPRVTIYTLTTDRTIYVMVPGTTLYVALGRVPNTYGNPVGIDFRPKEASRTRLYAVTDTQNIILIDLTNVTGTPKLISSLSSRFTAGFQSLMDFNPVVDAIRLIGSNTQNLAVVNSNGGNLNATAVQTSLTYAIGDINAGVVPTISGGAYTNNFAGAANTIFYAIDSDTDCLVTIDPAAAGGSSATAGGRLRTIGKVVNRAGARINFNPASDFDIYTDNNGINYLIGVNNMTLYNIPFNQINPNLQLGQTQTVVANTVRLNLFPNGDTLLDAAIPTGRGPVVASR